NVVTPNDAPTADRYAERWVLYGIMRAKCSPYLSADEAVITNGLADAFNNGNDLLGSGGWVSLWTGIFDQWLTEIAMRGELSTCIDVERLLREQGVSTGIYGPSFDCRNASTSTEHAMCED